MRARAIVLGVLLLCIGNTASFATVRIADDLGGRIDVYLQTFATLRNSRESVIIDGPCLSACTLILGLLPTNRVCVTNRARLGFHAAWIPDSRGRPIPSAIGTQILMDLYPPNVRGWLHRRGGLSRKMIFMQGRELAEFYRPCRVSR